MNQTHFRLLFILLIFLVFLLIFGIRYIRSKENMALIERGMTPPRSDKFVVNWTLVFSCLFFGLGLGLLAGHIAANYFMADSPVLAHWIFVSLFLGAALLTAYKVQEKKAK
jgi:hypothetical protein